MKIRNKINYSFISTFLIIIVLVGILVSLYIINTTKNDIYNSFRVNIFNDAEHIRTLIHEKKTTSSILAGASVYRDFLKESAKTKDSKVLGDKTNERLVKTIEADSDIYEAFVLNFNGKVIASSDISQIGKDKSQDEYFLKAQKETFIKDIYFSETIKKVNYTISSPILDDNGTFLGVSVLRFLPDHFYKILEDENIIKNTEESFLINKDKFFISPSRFFGKDAILKEKVETQNSNDCFDPKEIEYVTQNGYSNIVENFGNQIVEAKDYRDIDIIATHAYIPETGWCLILKIDKSELLSFRYDVFIYIVVLFLTSLFFFLIVGYFISNKITKPIEVLELETKKIRQGNFDYNKNFYSDDEIGHLYKSFGEMVQDLKKSKIEIELRVEEQTKEISKKINEVENQKVAILNILDDVGEEKRKSEELANIVLNANESIVSQSVDGIVLSWNNGARDLFGYSEEEIIGNKVDILIPEDKLEELKEIRKNIVNGIKVEHFQTIRKRKDGSLVDVSISFSPIKDESGRVVAISAISLDISKEKEIDKAKTEFVSLASHQLRTPLSAINWYTEMLLAGDAGILNKEQENYLKEIYSGNQKMVALVNALLNVSRLDLGTFLIEPKPVDVLSVVKSVLEELKGQILERKLKIEESYEDNIPEFQADPSFFRIIFQNLLSNSVKYTPEGGIVKVFVSTLLKDKSFGGKVVGVDSLVFSVADSGIGIPKNQIGKIFGKLFRADNARESETNGTGLGLYIIKSIIEKSDGEVWFESEEDKGTTFYVTFPLTGMKKVEGTKKLE